VKPPGQTTNRIFERDNVENCVTTVYAVWVTTAGQAWADFDVFMPERWEKDRRRRRAAGIPGACGTRPSRS